MLPGWQVFGLVWFGQLVSLIGSGLTRFALGIWIFQQTGAATQLGLVLLCAYLPGILISPWAGVVADRRSRRWVMILSDSAAALATGCVVGLLIFDRLEVWHLYLTASVSSIAEAFQWPAYVATTTLLLPKQHFGRASGLTNINMAAAQLVAPVLGGLLLVTIQLTGVLLLDFATFLVAVSILLVIRFPKVKSSVSGQAIIDSFISKVAYGWQYIAARPGLLSMQILIAFGNLGVGTIQVLFIPLLLSFSSVTIVGTVISLGGSGMLLGGLVMSVWGGPRRLINGVYGAQLMQAVCLLVAGIAPSVNLITAATFFYFFSLPILMGCSQAIWQKKVPSGTQGRVFAVRRLIAWSTLPLGYFLAGILADRVFEPLLNLNGPLAASLGALLGVGPGRGIGLMLVAMGLSGILVTFAAYQYSHLRRVEDELPDRIV
ncbi:MAG: MFS transporter [Anaerolineae bacterium]|nr:MFS transporter [Anaerolineae bacterium]